MKNAIISLCKVAILAAIVSFISVSCEKNTDVDYLELDEDIMPPLEVKSGILEGEKPNRFEVTKKMAELFIKGNKENPEIISIEPYILEDATCFYIINFEKGFRIVAADTRVQPILATSEEDNLYLSELNNKGLSLWLEDTAEKIHILKDSNPAIEEDYSELWSNYLSDDTPSVNTRSLDPDQEYIWIKVVETSMQPYYYYLNVNHLMSTKWGQEYPWNTSMPYDQYYHNDKCLAGCAPVAVGQVLYYFHSMNNTPNDLWHSVSISGTTPDNYGYLTISLSKSGYTTNSTRWAQMPLTSNGNNTSYVSDLLLDLGERLVVHYSKDNSHVVENPIDHSIPNLGQCGISSSIGSFNYTNVYNNINSGKPVIVKAIHSTLGWLEDGHIWVIDGCKDYLNRVTTTTSYYYIPTEDYLYYASIYNIVASYSNDDMLYLFPNAYDGMQSSSYFDDHLSFIRMNWGYNGNADNTDYGVTDSSSWINHQNCNYTYNRYIHYNISTSQLN